jgi:2'-5' RNA ligase
MRLFVAIPLPESLKDVLLPHLDGVPGKFRRVPPKNLHVTVLFLGEVDRSDLERIKDALASVASRHAPFDLHLKDVGVGPRPSKPRLIWARFRKHDAFTALCEDVRSALSPYIQNEDTRSPRPHITLARFARGQQDQFFPSVSALDGSLAVKDIQLWQSVLDPSGAKYSCLDSFALFPTNHPLG